MEWSRGHMLGHGSSATVSVATSSVSGHVFAVKSSELSRSELLQREQRLLSSLSSPFIVTYKGCDITKEQNKLFYNLFLEYMPFGTLLQEIRRHGGYLHAPIIASFTRQILKGLQYLHSNGIVHCDIKSTNILVGEEGAKISDFGCAKRVKETAAPISGTPMYMAPEVARGEKQGYACDIWALGCTVIEMASGESPWRNVAEPFSVLHRIAYSGESPEIPGFLPEEAKDFLEKCLRRNPEERWTANELVKHPFVGSKSKGEGIEESNSSSPTSILEQRFWSCVSVGESEIHGDLMETRFGDDRIRGLSEFSGEPNWEVDDENWITFRESDDDEGRKRRRKSGDVCKDNKCREISDVICCSLSNFERGIHNMLLPSMSVLL